MTIETKGNEKSIKFGKMMIEVDGVMTDITTLPRPQYERFLELMNQLRIVYITLTSRP
jgi:hypothetical protein